jgi:hypothetical protein
MSEPLMSEPLMSEPLMSELTAKVEKAEDPALAAAAGVPAVGGTPAPNTRPRSSDQATATELPRPSVAAADVDRGLAGGLTSSGPEWAF